MSSSDLFLPFEDILDGYFPLQTSIDHLLERVQADEVFLQIAHAPIMEIPGLPHDAPVPLNISAGRAGQIDTLELWAEWRDGLTQLAGQGRWKWFEGRNDSQFLDPLTRLAEPAFLTGYVKQPKFGPAPPDFAKLPARFTGKSITRGQVLLEHGFEKTWVSRKKNQILYSI